MSELKEYIAKLKEAGNTHTAAAFTEAQPVLTKLIDNGAVRGEAAERANASLIMAAGILAEMTNPYGGNLLSPGNYSQAFTSADQTSLGETVSLPEFSQQPINIEIDQSASFQNRLRSANLKYAEVTAALNELSVGESPNLSQKFIVEKMIRLAETSVPPDPYGHLNQLKSVLEFINEAISEYTRLQSQLGEFSTALGNIELAIQKDQKDIDNTKIQPKFGDVQGVAQREALEQRKALLNNASNVIDTQVGKRVDRTFKHQCFLQRYILQLTNSRISAESQSNIKLPYEEGPEAGRNRPLIVSGPAFGFMNTMTQPKSTSKLFELPPHVLSQLQPMVQLYKVVVDKDGKEKEIEIEFPSSITFLNSSGSLITAEEALRSQSRRGHGVGLKSFNFTYEGSDPFSLKKSISANLKIFATSFEDLLQPRVSKNNEMYRYADLALKTGTSLMKQYASVPVQSNSNSDSVIDNLDKLQFKLKAVVGYKMPANLHIPNKPKTTKEDIQKAIYNSFVTLNLTPTIHEFNIDDSGRVNFSINYLAYIDEFFDISYFNIFSDPLVTSNIYKRKVLRKYYEKECNLEGIGNLKKAEEAKTPIEQRASLRRIIEKLLAKNRINFINVSYDSLGEFTVSPFVDLNSIISQKADEPPPSLNPKPSPTAPNPATTAAAAQAVAPKQSSSPSWLSSLLPQPLTQEELDDRGILSDGSPKPASAGINANNDEQIAYFYLYDLIDIVMDNIEESLSENGYIKVLDELKNLPEDFISGEKKILKTARDNFKRYRVVLGPVELRDPSTPGYFISASMADIPISLVYFAEWMTEKVIARDRLEYNISSFISDVLKNYVRNFLNSEACHDGKLSQRVSTYSTAVTGYSLDSGDEITRRIKNLQQSDISNEHVGRLNLGQDPGSGAESNPMIVTSDCILNTMGRRDKPGGNLGVQNEINYQIFYSGRNKPKELLTGNKALDENNGIFHYILGRDVGIIKNIQLRRTDVTGLKEARFESEGFDGLQQLREQYNAEITTFAYPLAVPGINIFIDPRGFAPDTNSASEAFDKYDLSQYGIGGYFMVNKAQTNFSEGLAETKISAVWVLEQESGDEPPPSGKIEGATPSSRKCKAKQTRTKSGAGNGENPGAPQKDTVTVP